MIKLSNRLNNFNEYIFADLEKKVIDIEKQTGKKVLNFAIGNPDFPPHDIYIKKLGEFVKDKKAHLYPGYGANEEFSSALISWYKKRFNVDLKKTELLPLLGAKDAVAHLPLALVDEGDEILIPDPGYPGFLGTAKLLGAKLVTYDLLEENNFKISLEQLEEKISKKTKFIWINFPSNPTGQVTTLEELEKIVALAKRKKILIVFDNAYSDITFNNFIAPSILEIKGAKDICIEIGSFSKTFSFAGFRMGWAIGNEEVIRALSKVKSQFDSGLSTPLQNLGAYALTNFDKNWYKKMLLSYQKRRDIIATKLIQLGLTFFLPKGSLYIWAKIPKNAKNSQEFCLKLLKEKQILFTPGIAFGKNGQRYVRVSISTNIDKIEDYFKL